MKKFAVILFVMCLFVGSASAEAINLSIDGAMGKLSAIIQKPELEAGQKCSMVMLLHGFGSSKESRPIVDIANLLEKNGIASIRFDFNGHGESEGRFENMTVLNEIEDAKKVYEYVKGLDYVEGISAVGHSQGGVVTSMLAGELGREKIKSIVLLAAAASLRGDMLRGLALGTMFDAGNHPAEGVKLLAGLSKGRVLGRDYILTAQTLQIFKTAEKYTGSVCLIHGTADRLVPYTYSEFYDRIYQDSEIHLLDGADHAFNNVWSEVAEIAVEFLRKH